MMMQENARGALTADSGDSGADRALPVRAGRRGGPSSGTSVVPITVDDRDTADPLAELREWAVDRLRQGDVRPVVARLEELPFSSVLEHLDLSMALGLAAGLSGDTTSARALVTELERVERSIGLPAEARVALAHLELALCLWEGRMIDLAGAVEVLAAELTSARELHPQRYIIDGSAAHAALATGLLAAGRLDEAVRAANQALVVTELMPVSRNAVLASGIKALALAWSGATQPSREAARQALAILDRFAGVGSSAMAVHAARCWSGPLDGLVEAVEAVEAAHRELPLPTYDVLVALCRAKASIRLGDLGAAVAALAVADDSLQAMPQPGFFGVLTEHVREEVGQEGSTRLHSLAPVEVRMLELLAAGATRSEIAHELHYSINTVKTHLRHAYRKLGAGTRSEAIRNARLRGVIGPGCEPLPTMT